MALVDIEYVETTMAVTFTDAEKVQCAQLVDEISEFIHVYTGKEFDNPNYYPKGIPATISGVASRAVIRGMNSVPVDLTTLTVGDVTEVYATFLDFPAADKQILELYGGGVGTFHLEATTNQLLPTIRLGLMRSDGRWDCE